MPNLPQIVQNQKEHSSVDLKDSSVFSQQVNTAVVHQVIKAIEANGRAQSSKKGFDNRLPYKKNRGEVVGSTRKIRAQKGSGRARVSTTKSPLFVGGGQTFASCKPNYFQKINKKMFRLAVRSVFANLASTDRLVVGEIQLAEPKTKVAQQWFNAHGLDETNCLIILESFDEQVFLATRNLPRVNVITVDEIDPRRLLLHKKVLVHPAALTKIEEMYS